MLNEQVLREIFEGSSDPSSVRAALAECGVAMTHSGQVFVNKKMLGGVDEALADVKAYHDTFAALDKLPESYGNGFAAGVQMAFYVIYGEQLTMGRVRRALGL